jgi:hypothetical protein
MADLAEGEGAIRHPVARRLGALRFLGNACDTTGFDREVSILPAQKPMETQLAGAIV